MYKETLRKLRALPATKEMMEKGRLYKTEKRRSYYTDSKEYEVIIPKYDILIRCQNLNGYIKVAVFLPEMMRKNIKTPRYEIFINPEGKEWITRELDEEGKEKCWHTSMIYNLEGLNINPYSSNKVFMNADAKKTLNRLQADEDMLSGKYYSVNGIGRLQCWQQEQRAMRIEEKERKEQEPWDRDMELVPEITKGFMEWMRKDVCPDIFIIYEYSKTGATKGYCSRCRRDVAIINPKHGKKTVCPSCRAQAEFKSSGKIKCLKTKEYEAEIIQKMKDGIVIRKYYGAQYYIGCDYRKPNIYTNEISRVLIFNDGTVRTYEWGLYKNKKNRWIRKDIKPDYRGTFYWASRIKLYKRNLLGLRSNPVIRNSAISLWETLPATASDYLAIEKMYPAVEMLAKIGMFRLAEEFIKGTGERSSLDHTETELPKILKLDKARLKRLKEMDGNHYMLKWMQTEKLTDTVWPDEMIKDLGNAWISVSDLNFLPHPVKHEKAYNYLKRQSETMKDSIHQAYVTWRDYINMAEQMKMDTKNERIKKPKDLKREHDRLVLVSKTKGLEKQAKEIEKKWPKVNAQLKKLQKFEFTSGEYTIVAPKEVLDIVKEGVVLGHCVHSCDYYYSRIQTDESYLFFLRKSASQDMPWYTLEVEPSGNIRQKRTTGDNQNKDLDEALGFLKKWQKYFRKQLTAEEKELGDKADRIRIKNYETLRENGNRVWHGKLQGQLLADVLEADFMSAI